MDSAVALSHFKVQKVLLTGTLPPFWERDLADNIGFSFATLRLKTPRPEIKYVCQQVHN
jgi:hypothetical protein